MRYEYFLKYSTEQLFFKHISIASPEKTAFSMYGVLTRHGAYAVMT